jgi:succinate-semialdehyde dehydrogenase/glutarate-semialdehyde dehydrogenase
VGASAGFNIKPAVLELGGSDAFVILAGADIQAAAQSAVQARMQNNGQSCIAAKRFIVEAPVADEFLSEFASRIRSLTVGDPMNRAVDLGPLARADLRDEVTDQVGRACLDGAKALVGGNSKAGPGWYYEPTLLTDVRRHTVAFTEEIFGPVASLIVARDVDHAVDLANESPFGLGGCVFTQDLELGERVARQLEVGCAFVNGMVKSDPRLPFGGIKESGYGRELSTAGIRSFINEKSVWIA